MKSVDVAVSHELPTVQFANVTTYEDLSVTQPIDLSWPPQALSERNRRNDLRHGNCGTTNSLIRNRNEGTSVTITLHQSQDRSVGLNLPVGRVRLLLVATGEIR